VTAGSAGFRFQASQGRRIEPLPAVAWVVSVYRSPASLEAQPPLPLKEWIDRLFWCVLSALSLSCRESKRRDVRVLCVGKSPTLAQSIAGESRFASMCLPERRARRVRWLEGPACRVRKTTLDDPSRFIWRDKHAPPPPGGTCLSGPPRNVGRSILGSAGTTGMPLLGHDKRAPPIVGGTFSDGRACRVHRTKHSRERPSRLPQRLDEFDPATTNVLQVLSTREGNRGSPV